ncbi:hypothetical protein [Streptomyces sp. NPDC056061]|uniref:hypothetical protein n=1 Tax=Streptomyces sp. NPDC056061 TaxID=3345700 RepID=UPI0035E25B11
MGDGTGVVSQMADDMEDLQLDMADELLGHAVDLLADRRATEPQIRFLTDRLTESLRQVVRVAESRGLRLGAISSLRAGPVSERCEPERHEPERHEPGRRDPERGEPDVEVP